MGVDTPEVVKSKVGSLINGKSLREINAILVTIVDGGALVIYTVQILKLMVGVMRKTT